MHRQQQQQERLLKHPLQRRRCSTLMASETYVNQRHSLFLFLSSSLSLIFTFFFSQHSIARFSSSFVRVPASFLPLRPKGHDEGLLYALAGSDGTEEHFQQQQGCCLRTSTRPPSLSLRRRPIGIVKGKVDDVFAKPRPLVAPPGLLGGLLRGPRQRRGGRGRRRRSHDRLGGERQEPVDCRCQREGRCRRALFSVGNGEARSREEKALAFGLARARRGRALPLLPPAHDDRHDHLYPLGLCSGTGAFAI